MYLSVQRHGRVPCLHIHTMTLPTTLPCDRALLLTSLSTSMCGSPVSHWACAHPHHNPSYNPCLQTGCISHLLVDLHVKAAHAHIQHHGPAYDSNVPQQVICKPALSPTSLSTSMWGSPVCVTWTMHTSMPPPTNEPLLANRLHRSPPCQPPCEGCPCAHSNRGPARNSCALK